jgi:hypothetical protein
MKPIVELVLKYVGGVTQRKLFASAVARTSYARDTCCTPLVDKQIPEQARKLRSSESDVLMPQESVDDVSTTVDDVAEVTLMLWSYPSSAPTGQPMVVSHGWFMQ